MARLNLENLSGLLTRESPLSSLSAPAAAGEGSFDEHLLRAQSTAEQADNSSRFESEHSSAADLRSADRESAAPRRNDAALEAQGASARRKAPGSAGRDRRTTPDASASSHANDDSSRKRSAVDADREKRKSDRQDNGESGTAAGAGGGPNGQPASKESQDADGGGSDKAPNGSADQTGNGSPGAGVAATGEGATGGIATASGASVLATNAAGTAALQEAVGAPQAEGRPNAAEPGRGSGKSGADNGSPGTNNKPPVSATDADPKTADAMQAAAAVAQSATAAAAIQGAKVQEAGQPSASDPTMATPVSADSEAQAGSQQPSNSDVAPIATAFHRVTSPGGATAFAQSLAEGADAGIQSFDGQADAAQTVTLTSSPSAAADAAKPASPASERAARANKPTEGSVSGSEAATKPSAPAVGPARGESAPASDQADRVRFVQRVAQAFESAADRGGTVRLRLSPPELGSLRLELTVRNGKMSAHIEAETQSARSLLLDNLPALRQRLADHQIRLERFDVDWGGQPSSGLPQQSRDQTGSGNWQTGSHVARSDPQTGAAPPADQPVAARPGYGGRLDVVI